MNVRKIKVVVVEVVLVVVEVVVVVVVVVQRRFYLHIKTHKYKTPQGK